MAETKNIMIVGVGGQGTLLTSRILGGITVEAGYDVKLSEVHGMAQRGGSVVTYVRYGEKVAEPIVEEGQADVLGSRRGRSGHGYTRRAGIYLKAALCRPAQDSPPEADMHGRKIFLPENVQGVLIPGFSAYDVKKSSGDSF